MHRQIKLYEAHNRVGPTLGSCSSKSMFEIDFTHYFSSFGGGFGSTAVQLTMHDSAKTRRFFSFLLLLSSFLSVWVLKRQKTILLNEVKIPDTYITVQLLRTKKLQARKVVSHRPLFGTVQISSITSNVVVNVVYMTAKWTVPKSVRCGTTFEACNFFVRRSWIVM